MAFDNSNAVTYSIGTGMSTESNKRLKFKVTQQGSFMGSGDIYEGIGQLISNMTDDFVLMSGGRGSVAFSPNKE